MRLKAKGIKKIALTCAGIIFLISVHVASVYIFAVHRFTVSYDPTVSEKAQAHIEDFIQLSTVYAVASPLKVVQQLQEQFPFIQKVNCSYTPSGLHLFIKTYHPCIKLEHNELVTTNNYRVPADYFTSSALENLPVLYASLNDSNRLPEEMFAYVTAIDPDLLKGGAVRWHHTNEIVCFLHGQPMNFVCNYQTRPTQKIIRQCLDIKQDLKDRPGLAQKFSADVRFADRIIVAKIRNEGAQA